jgi:hypothetical protein
MRRGAAPIRTRGARDPYLSVNDFARLYSVSRSTVWRWIARDWVDVQRFGGGRRTVRVRARRSGSH